MLDQLETYRRLFEAAPLPAQIAIAIGAILAALATGRIAWRLSAPVRWVARAALGAVTGVHSSSRRFDACERGSGESVSRLATRTTRLEEKLTNHGGTVADLATRLRFLEERKRDQDTNIRALSRLASNVADRVEKLNQAVSNLNDGSRIQAQVALESARHAEAVHKRLDALEAQPVATLEEREAGPELGVTMAQATEEMKRLGDALRSVPPVQKREPTLGELRQVAGILEEGEPPHYRRGGMVASSFHWRPQPPKHNDVAEAIRRAILGAGVELASEDGKRIYERAAAFQGGWSDLPAHAAQSAADVIVARPKQSPT